jgi:hypothetical protein
MKNRLEIWKDYIPEELIFSIVLYIRLIKLRKREQCIGFRTIKIILAFQI